MAARTMNIIYYTTDNSIQQVYRELATYITSNKIKAKIRTMYENWIIDINRDEPNCITIQDGEDSKLGRYLYATKEISSTIDPRITCSSYQEFIDALHRLIDLQEL